MNNLFSLKLFLYIFCFYACNNIDFKKENSIVNQTEKKQIEAIPEEAIALITSYPKSIIGYQNNHIIFADSTTMIFDDSIVKSPEELINSPDLQDMFVYNYVEGPITKNYVPDEDPGRIRNEEFFKKIYGLSKGEVLDNLVEMNWCPNLAGIKIKVTTINDIHLKLTEISNELDKHEEFLPYISKLGGTFNWRTIKDTDRLSMHSFGLSIDLNVSMSNYWKWDLRKNNGDFKLNYKNKFPNEIILIFEKHGFIWGGKWKHYDTMHFEYRPELLL